MALNIRNSNADKLATELARRTGETKTQAVIAALQARLKHVRRENKCRSLENELTEIANQCAELPIRDRRDADKILGYGDDGLPH